ncbi:matrixin family metalloprotease [Nannocystis sp.]|uniref:matrixin family metalloprotease n=1 Tax=Nannocystis sp. TaxID=1962667 RepID=UPI0025E0FC2E|nr:matrixin family metalloprotease [Nannocystis sp.]
MAKLRTISMAEMKSHTLAKPYVPSVTGLKRGDSGVQVDRLQQYLQKFGYLNAGARTAGFDDSTEQALRKFQRLNHLPETGTLGDETLAKISQPRCGFPDSGGASGPLGEFTLQGGKWNKTNITYSFANTTADLTEAEVKRAFYQALLLWAEVTPLTFNEVAAGGAADMILRFAPGDHGCGYPFDGPSGVLAHGFYPPPNGTYPGDIHFDEAETWSVNTPPTGFDLTTVAAHEIGHALGLAHSSINGALMYAYYGGAHRNLESDDISGIQAIYGAVWRQPNWRWCSKCEGLHFGGNTPGRCPAGGGHITTGSGNYALAHNTSIVPGQSNWRYCSKCEGLHFGGNTPGVCPAGGGHTAAGSGNYTLAHEDSTANGQSNWRYCNKCEGLHFGGNGPGVCPAGGGHIMNPSGNYTLFHL